MTTRDTRRDLVGQTFHKWRVLAFSHVGASGKQYWNCQCACGATKDIDAYNLTSGRSKSCRKCSAKVVGEDKTTHGMSNTKVYRTWQSMKTRCYNENNEKTYKYHGALGVKVADEWINDFEAFYAEIGEPPTKYHTIDRINPNGDYAPGNVRWATQSEQMRNTRARAGVRPRRMRRLGDVR